MTAAAPVTASDRVWLSWFGAWVALELAGYSKHVPWTTLSEYAWSLEGRARWVRNVFLFGLLTLAVHIAFKWPAAEE